MHGLASLDLTLADFEDAAKLVHAVMPPTPQYRWPQLCARTGAQVWLKHENATPTGAFKVRGGIAYFDALRRERPDVREVVTATRGNHGQSVAFAAGRSGIRATIVVPHENSREKNAAMLALGCELIERGADFQEAREFAEQLAHERGALMLPSFDRQLVRGVGTYALELFAAVERLDTVYVPIGLGSGICGLIAVRDALGLPTEIVGVVARRYPAYALSFGAGHAVSTHETPPTIMDGMACRVPEPVAVEILRHGADRIVEVDEPEAEAAMRVLFSDTHTVAEGAGAAAFAALVHEGERQRGKRVAAIVCGSNVDRAEFARILGTSD